MVFSLFLFFFFFFNRRIFDPDLCLHFRIFSRCACGPLEVFDHNLECHVGSQPPSPAVTYNCQTQTLHSLPILQFNIHLHQQDCFRSYQATQKQGQLIFYLMTLVRNTWIFQKFQWNSSVLFCFVLALSLLFFSFYLFIYYFQLNTCLV